MPMPILGKKMLERPFLNGCLNGRHSTLLSSVYRRLHFFGGYSSWWLRYHISTYNISAMQNPNLDTEWNDALRRHGILPEKRELEITQDQIENVVDSVIKQKTEERQLNELSLDELDEKEDDEDDAILQQIRQKRILEMKEKQNAAVHGDIREISANEYVEQVTNAGDGSVSTNCIKNYPDKNLPTIFVYHDGEMKGQFVGPFAFGGMKLNQDCLEWMLSSVGVFETTLKEDPRKQDTKSGNTMTILTRDRKAVQDSDSDDDDD